VSGHVYIVGAGPGDPELLTMKAFRVLCEADVILHDELVTPQILLLAPEHAVLLNVGKRCGRKSTSQKEINSTMIAHAQAGLTVVRLKGGDPLIFGRAAEEILALRAANVPFEIVPGITAALGAAASSHVPLSQRHIAPAITFVTYSRAGAELPVNWRCIIQSGATIALYMPGDDYKSIADDLRGAGLGAETPCLLVSRATSLHEQIESCSLQQLATMPVLPAPTLMVIGCVADHALESALSLADANIAPDAQLYS
jgi:uroporphyrin-III C-methyltransferase